MNGNSLIHEICKHKSENLLQKVIDIGADVNAFNANGHTALRIVCKSELKEGVKALIENNANNEILDNQRNLVISLMMLLFYQS